MGDRAVGLAQLLEVGLIDTADVADDVRGQFGMRITPVEVGHQLDAGEAPAVDGEACHFLGFDPRLERERLEAPAGAPRLALLLPVLELGRASCRERVCQYV